MAGIVKGDRRRVHIEGVQEVGLAVDRVILLTSIEATCRRFLRVSGARKLSLRVWIEDDSKAHCAEGGGRLLDQIVEESVGRQR